MSPAAQEITGLPVLVTEHGVDFDDADDDVRATLIEDTLRVLAPAIADGLDVRGYLHWSLVDNFEWFNGYHGHFGLLGQRPGNTTALDTAQRHSLRLDRPRQRVSPAPADPR